MSQNYETDRENVTVHYVTHRGHPVGRCLSLEHLADCLKGLWQARMTATARSIPVAAGAEYDIVGEVRKDTTGRLTWWAEAPNTTRGFRSHDRDLRIAPPR